MKSEYDLPSTNTQCEYLSCCCNTNGICDDPSLNKNNKESGCYYWSIEYMISYLNLLNEDDSE